MKRKETSAQKRKNNFAAKIAQNGNPLKVTHVNKKKGLKLSAIMAKFPDKGLYIVPAAGGGHAARCACNQKIISDNNKDYYSILKHVETTKKHAAFIQQQRKLSQQKEAQLSIAGPAELGVVHMDLDGTRVSSDLTVDQAFRFCVT
jgi:hypothetical protein